jgi:DNA-binding transcriptional LysR family regulator
LDHGIDGLEQWLDVELFERKTREIVLTSGRTSVPSSKPRRKLI